MQHHRLIIASSDGHASSPRQALLSLFVVWTLLVANSLWATQPISNPISSHGPYSEQFTTGPTLALLRSALVVSAAESGNTSDTDEPDPPWQLGKPTLTWHRLAARQRHWKRSPDHHPAQRRHVQQPRAPPRLS